ncbi:MAG: arylesterase [Pseudomonadales bacterium]
MIKRFRRFSGWAIIALLFNIALLAPHYSHAEECNSKVLLLGDSIGAGYGLARSESWAAMLAKELSQGDVDFVNASVSGETSAGGLRRVEQLLDEHKPGLLILELGGNDGLRGYPLERLEQNLMAIVDIASEAGANSYVLGMRIPPNYGPVYTRRFHDVFAQVAQKTDSAYLPFLLEGIGDKFEFMQADGIHPNAEAQATIFQTVKEQLPMPCN